MQSLCGCKQRIQLGKVGISLGARAEARWELPGIILEAFLAPEFSRHSPLSGLLERLLRTCVGCREIQGGLGLPGGIGMP